MTAKKREPVNYRFTLEFTSLGTVRDINSVKRGIREICQANDAIKKVKLRSEKII